MTFYVKVYDAGIDDLYQFETEDGEVAVREAVKGRQVERQPILNGVGKPYPIRSADPRKAAEEREAEIRKRLGVPKPEKPPQRETRAALVAEGRSWMGT